MSQTQYPLRDVALMNRAWRVGLGIRLGLDSFKNVSRIYVRRSIFAPRIHSRLSATPSAPIRIVSLPSVRALTHPRPEGGGDALESGTESDTRAAPRPAAERGATGALQLALVRVKERTSPPLPVWTVVPPRGALAAAMPLPPAPWPRRISPSPLPPLARIDGASSPPADGSSPSAAIGSAAPLRSADASSLRARLQCAPCADPCAIRSFA